MHTVEWMHHSYSKRNSESDLKMWAPTHTPLIIVFSFLETSIIPRSLTEFLEHMLMMASEDGIAILRKLPRVLEKLEKSLPFDSREHGRFKLTGLDIEQLPDLSIKVNQGKYINKISPIDIPKMRRAEPDSPIDAKEMCQLRGLCGSLPYAAVMEARHSNTCRMPSKKHSPCHSGNLACRESYFKGSPKIQ